MLSYINKKIVLLLSIFVILFVGLILFLMSIYTVKENEYGVVYRFGKISEVKEEPGLYFKTPVLDNVVKFPNNIQFYDIAKSDVITSDKK